MSARNEGHESRTDTERLVDELEDKVLGEQPERDREHPDRRASLNEPAFEQDKDIEDLPGGAGESGGSSDEPPS